MRARTRQHGFTLIELAVVVAALFVAAALLYLLLPGIGARRLGTPMTAQTRIRGIGQAMFTYSQSNRNYLPGMDENGELVPGGVEMRYQLMLEADCFTGDYAISPEDVKTVWTGGNVTSENYSFTMLDIDEPGGRQQVWRAEFSTDTALMSDRNTGTDTQSGLRSLHTNKFGDWDGWVLWSDNHTSFETRPVLQGTRYGLAQHAEDHLFEARGGDDAMMIYEGD